MWAVRLMPRAHASYSGHAAARACIWLNLTINHNLNARLTRTLAPTLTLTLTEINNKDAGRVGGTADAAHARLLLRACHRARVPGRRAYCCTVFGSPAAQRVHTSLPTPLYFSNSNYSRHVTIKSLIIIFIYPMHVSLYRVRPLRKGGVARVQLFVYHYMSLPHVIAVLCF